METFKQKFLSKEGEWVEFETIYQYLILDTTHNHSVYRKFFDDTYLNDWLTSKEEALKSLWRTVLNSNDNYVVTEDGEFIYNNDSKDQEMLYAKEETSFSKDGHYYHIVSIEEILNDQFICSSPDDERFLLTQLNALSQSNFKINKI